MTMDKLKIFVEPASRPVLANLSRFLAEEGVEAYLVGGFVRDTLLGRASADIDVAVVANALTVASRAASALGGKYVLLDEENATGRVILYEKAEAPGKRWELDFTTVQNDIENDLARRDFTIDAMAIRLDDSFINILASSAEAEIGIGADFIIDPCHGREDLNNGILRAVSDTVFTEDAARLLRAVRLTSELDFKIDGQTEDLIRDFSRLIASVPGERTREELLRLLALPGAGGKLFYLEQLGLLTAIFPELIPARGVTQPLMHVWDVFEHSIHTVAALEFLLGEGNWEFQDKKILDVVPWSDEIRQHFDQDVSHGSTRRSLLKLSALLHDIAKPQTKSVEEDGRVHFLGHPQEGAEAAARLLERLRFSTRESKFIELLIKYHLRPTQMSQEGLPSRRAIYRYFRDTDEAGIDIMFLNLADHLASRGASLDLAQWAEHAHIVEYVINKRFEEQDLRAPQNLIDGHEVMQAFGLRPGPRIGELLEAVREALAAGEIGTKEEALDYLRNRIIT